MSALDLTWRRVSPGLYVASAPINGEAAAFQARVWSANGDWWHRTMTYGRPLGSGQHDSMADAKAAAQVTYYAVESVNR